MHFNIKRIWQWTAIFLGLILFGLYLGLPIGMGVAAVVPAKEAVGLPPAGFNEITLLPVIMKH